MCKYTFRNKRRTRELNRFNSWKNKNLFPGAGSTDARINSILRLRWFLSFSWYPMKAINHESQKTISGVTKEESFLCLYFVSTNFSRSRKHIILHVLVYNISLINYSQLGYLRKLFFHLSITEFIRKTQQVQLMMSSASFGQKSLVNNIPKPRKRNEWFGWNLGEELRRQWA